MVVGVEGATPTAVIGGCTSVVGGLEGAAAVEDCARAVPLEIKKQAKIKTQ